MVLDRAGQRPLRLAYGTNVSPAEDLPALLAALEGFWADVRQRAVPDGTLGLGVWFAEDAARALAADAGAMRRLRDVLAANRLRLETVNAFPQRAFHARVVKEAVYRPDWLDPARFAYTSSVARAVAGIVPPGSDVPVSTLPLGFPKWEMKEWLRASGLLFATVLDLHRIREATGTTIRLALEPEPCCALETTSEAIEYFGAALAPFTGSLAQAGGISEETANEIARRHLGVCLDLCHAAVEHELPWESFLRLRAAGVPVTKVQVSAAVEVHDPSDPAQRTALRAFDEPRWLHQVGLGPGRVVRDVPRALEHAHRSAAGPWRVHFHVPVHLAEVGRLPTTRPLVERFLAQVRDDPDPPVLEIETYTWSVVPGARPGLAANVAAEIDWVAARLR